MIFLRDVKGVASRLDIKEVSDGYARNLLIPMGLARTATPDAVKELESLKRSADKEDAELKRHLLALREKLSERHLTFFVKTNEDGGVFGSVTKEMVLKALRENKLVTKERLNIKMDHPLKDLGEHVLEADLKKGITAKITVILQKQT